MCCSESFTHYSFDRPIHWSKYVHILSCLYFITINFERAFLLVAEINANAYWRTPFNALSGTKQLAEYIVMDIEIIHEREKRTFAGQGATSFKV